SIDSSIVHNGTSMDSEVWPDIRHATGRDILEVGDTELKLAMYYEIAILRAAQGSPEFESALRAADAQVNDSLSRKSEAGRIVNLQFVALNWAWLHQRVRNEDLGIYAAYGALWERIADQRPVYQSWALHY